MVEPILTSNLEKFEPGAEATFAIAAIELYQEMKTFMPSEDCCKSLLMRCLEIFPQPSFSMVTNVEVEYVTVYLF
jgi:hypothetical protein